MNAPRKPVSRARFLAGAAALAVSVLAASVWAPPAAADTACYDRCLKTYTECTADAKTLEQVNACREAKQRCLEDCGIDRSTSAVARRPAVPPPQPRSEVVRRTPPRL